MRHVMHQECWQSSVLGTLAGQRGGRMNSTYSPNQSHPPRLSAVQGSSEERTELYKTVLRRSTGSDDAAMHQECWQSSVLGTLAGQRGGRMR